SCPVGICHISAHCLTTTSCHCGGPSRIRQNHRGKTTQSTHTTKPTAHTHTQTYTYTHTQTCTHTHTQTCTHTHTHTHTQTRTPPTCTNTSTHTHNNMSYNSPLGRYVHYTHTHNIN